MDSIFGTGCSTPICSTCQKSMLFCACSSPLWSSSPYYATPLPNYSNTFSTGCSYSSRYKSKIFEVITKKELTSCGTFETESDGKQGISGTVTSLELPVDYENYFYNIRNDYSNRWQILLPLIFRIDIYKEKETVVKFFSLIKFFDLKIYPNYLVLHNADFQEIANNLELTRLVEIQRVFVKILRRL